MAVRSLFAFLFIGVFVYYKHGFSAFQVLRYGAVKIRISVEVAATLMYLFALFRMPIGNVTAILQVIPLLVTVGGAILFREQVGIRRWTAIAIGFFGVLLIIRPGLQGFDAWSIFALAAACCLSIRDLATRRIPTQVSTLSVAWMTTLAVGLFGLLMSPFESWQPIDLQTLAYLAAAAFFILIGYIFIILAVRRSNLAVIAPFHYSTIVWALVIGFFVWTEIPDILTVTGILILVSTGLYAFIREKRLTEQASVDRQL